MVWESLTSPADNHNGTILGRIYDENGSTRLPEFQVNSLTSYSQTKPDIDAGSSGQFVVVWQSSRSNGTDSSSFSVQARRFDNTGTSIGDDFQVNTFTTDRQNFMTVAIDPGSGNFVVAWQSEGSYGDDSGVSVQAQLYDPNGAPVGGEFQVNTVVGGSQRKPKATFDSQGDFVVVWQTYTNGNQPGNLIKGQKFSPTGGKLGLEFQINTYTNDVQNTPDIDLLPSDGFVVVWADRGVPSGDYNVMARRFDTDSNPLSGPFVVNAYTTGGQTLPVVSSAPNGDFVVSWQAYREESGTDNSGWSVRGQLLLSDGTPIGEQFQVNRFTTSLQSISDVAMGPGGEFVVVWQSYGSYGDDNLATAVNAHRFGGPEVISATGMDDGTLDDWDAVVPPVP